jgi:MoaA/NifB/PqqE/SkfB family radical SAM enzyme
MKTIKFAYLFLTEGCNLSCRHCYGSFNSTNELAIEDWKSIIDDLISNRIFYYILSGGEPTLYKGFTELIEYLAKKNQYFTVVTNGIYNTITDTQLIKYQKHLISLKISLDGYNFETYNYLRQVNSEKIYRKLLTRIRKYRNMGMEVILGINIHSNTIDHIENFCEVINKLSPSAIQISSIANAGNAKNLPDTDKFFSIEQIEHIKSKFLANTNKKIAVDFVDMPFRSPKGFGYTCPALSDFIAISSDGKILPCPLFNEPQLKNLFPWPSVLNEGFAGSFQSKLLKDLAKDKASPCLYNNKKCINQDKCFRCIAQSLLNGKITAPPTFCIQYEKEIF